MLKHFRWTQDTSIMNISNQKTQTQERQSYVNSPEQVSHKAFWEEAKQFSHSD